MGVRELRALQRVTEIAFFLTCHQKYPSKHAKDRYERILGRCHSDLRRAYHGGGGRRRFYASIIPLANSLGMPDDWLEPYSAVALLKGWREKRSLETLKNLGLFYGTHGRYPSRYAEQVVEADLGSWLQTMRQYYRTGNGLFYGSLISLGVRLGLPGDWYVSKSRVRKCVGVVRD